MRSLTEASTLTRADSVGFVDAVVRDTLLALQRPHSPQAPGVAMMCTGPSYRTYTVSRACVNDASRPKGPLEGPVTPPSHSQRGAG